MLHNTETWKRPGTVGQLASVYCTLHQTEKIIWLVNNFFWNLYQDWICTSLDMGYGLSHLLYHCVLQRRTTFPNFFFSLGFNLEQYFGFILLKVAQVAMIKVFKVFGSHPWHLKQNPLFWRNQIQKPTVPWVVNLWESRIWLQSN